MKLWLLDILACPIDKHYPLELTIFQWEGESSEMFVPPESINNDSDMPLIIQVEPENLSDSDKIDELLQAYHNQSLHPDTNEQEHSFHISIDEADIIISDLLIIEPTPFDQYLTKTIASTEEIQFVSDKSSWKGQEAINLIQNTILPKLKEVHAKTSKITDNENKTDQQQQLLQEIEMELEFLNQFKYNIEIQEGIMLCSECGRWYPIFETIPQMLPDKVRNTKSDAGFKKRWEDLVNFPE